MPKPRAPIASRLRSREQTTQEPRPSYTYSSSSSSRSPSPAPTASPTHQIRRQRTIQKKDRLKSLNEPVFSPRTHPEIYLRELNQSLSNIRSTAFKRSRLSTSPPPPPLPSLPFAPIPIKNTTTTTTPLSHEPPKKRRRRQRATNAQQSTALRLDDPAPRSLNQRDQEKEYWRRQRRVFVRSRCISHQEAAEIAKGVYHRDISTHDRMVVSFQANMANFRTKWRKTIRDQVKLLGLASGEDVDRKVNLDVIKSIWGHWISDGYIDSVGFYANKGAVDALKSVTTEAIKKCLELDQDLMDEKKFRLALDRLDQHTRDLALP